MREEHIRASALPNLLLVGVKKAGTTSLFDWLGQHPDVTPADVKAVNYFTPLRFGAVELPPLADYTAHFPEGAATAYRFESSTTYLYGGDRVAEAVAETLPDVRVLVSLRDPTTRLWSEFQEKQRQRTPQLRDTSFDEFVTNAEATYAAGLADTRPGYAGFARGVYVDVLTPWLERFGPRMRVLFVETWSREPETTMRDLCRWLGIDEGPVSDLVYVRRNPNVDFRSRAAADFARRLYRAAAHRLPGAARLKPRLVAAHDRANGQRAAARLDDQTRRRVDELYRPHNERLADLLLSQGVTDLPPWLARRTVAGGAV